MELVVGREEQLAEVMGAGAQGGGQFGRFSFFHVYCSMQDTLSHLNGPICSLKSNSVLIPGRLIIPGLNDMISGLPNAQ